jgi:hypothetical protein
MDTKKMVSVGFDGGYGSLKMWGVAGGLEMLSQVAVNGGGHFEGMIGLKQAERPMMIETADGQFYVGARSHNYGRRVENMNFDRFGGSPEMRVMVYGIFTKYIQQYGDFADPLSVMVGLPLGMMGEDLKESRLAIRRWMMGRHDWQADGKPYSLEVGRVRWNSQPVGALFDYVMDFDGSPVLGHERALRERIGVLSVGMNTVEKMVIDNQTLNEALTDSDKLGVRRLLELVNDKRSIGEKDVALRLGNLRYKDKLPVWASEVNGCIERKWGEDLESFAAVLVVGGGALLLGSQLNLIAGGVNKVVIAENPVLSIASGLYKLDKVK